MAVINPFLIINSSNKDIIMVVSYVFKAYSNASEYLNFFNNFSYWVNLLKEGF